jgi:PEGA domain-containing protein
MLRVLRLGCMASLLFSASVWAQPAPQELPPPPPPPGGGQQGMEDAKRHFQQGVALYNEGNFNSALVEFQAAYKSYPTPGVLYNIGLTQKSLFRYGEAIESLNKYMAEDPKLTPERKNEVQQLIADMKLLLADVTIYVVPDGATVMLDGRTVGTAPLKPLGIAAGNHVIEATADGFKAARKEVVVVAQQPLAVELKLAAIPKSGKVHITASQPLSHVRIDGRDMGVAPVDTELAIGGHQLEVDAVGYMTNRSELVIAGGQTRDVNVVMELPPAPAHQAVYQKWWFWAAAGAVVIGAVGIGVAAGSSTESPIQGSLNPGAQKVN